MDVHVYEARNRVGGRVFSVKLGELGGHNISDGGKAENMRRLIESLDLEVFEKEVPLQWKCCVDGERKSVDFESLEKNSLLFLKIVKI